MANNDYCHAWSIVALRRYGKILKISPGAYIFQRPFFRGLYYGGKFVLQNQLD